VLYLDAAGHIISSQLSVPASHDGSCSPSKALAALSALQQDADAMAEPREVAVVVKGPGLAPRVPTAPDAPPQDLAAAAGEVQ
jgi:hypothetical protein